ncbi:hypothetical protein AMECASPLE_007645 [Ameca splendens]|uniref:LIM zinc-binding domain-containing protein n=1 Tax=Ameca splendens TaxID=208324 RepID=A0ABV0YN38_9TELE
MEVKRLLEKQTACNPKGALSASITDWMCSRGPTQPLKTSQGLGEAELRCPWNRTAVDVTLNPGSRLYCRDDGGQLALFLLPGGSRREECHRPISVETKELSHKGRHWHEECFRCTKCYKPLAKEPFNTKDERIMCVKCCSRDAAPRCHSCYKPILAGSESVAYKGNSWHDECFTCCSCKRPIASQSFLSKDDAVYCNPCYDEKFVKSCVSCKKPITSGGVNYQEQPWHSHCFVCSSCSKPLAGSSFTTHQDQVFCVDCYKSSVAKKCSGCQNPITGLIKLKLFLVVMTEQNTL